MHDENISEGIDGDDGEPVTELTHITDSHGSGKLYLVSKRKEPNTLTDHLTVAIVLTSDIDRGRFTVSVQ